MLSPRRTKGGEEEEEEIPTEVIAESIELAKKQQEAKAGEPTSSELALFDDVEAENSSTVAEPKLQKFEKLGATPSKAKSKAVDEAVDRIRIWQSTKLDLDENRESIDHLMKDLDLLHRGNVARRPILEISLGLARDVLNLHNHYEDLKPSFNSSEFCKTTHEANLADYQKQKAELDVLVADYKETKSAADKLEKHIEDLKKQLAALRERQNDFGAGLGVKTKAIFLVQSIVSASKLALEIAEASVHQGVPL
ncbi:hypothetical protein L3X38_017772 [Prunus dulcis]|uniref:Uncharacterized protein n=1 Tax=Prunus dulcis TaxID=3755 RepID=A0AAD4W8H9_PRUDU|nr:hypothetical protein L3X38_017772 [Prunus dulcis]